MAEKKAAFVEHKQPPLAFIDNEGYYSEDFETDAEDQSDDDGSETVTGRMREGIFSGLFFKGHSTILSYFFHNDNKESVWCTQCYQKWKNSEVKFSMKDCEIISMASANDF